MQSSSEQNQTVRKSSTTDSYDSKCTKNSLLEDQGYQIIKSIGSGAFATVMVHRHTICGRKSNPLIIYKEFCLFRQPIPKGRSQLLQ